MPDISRHLCSCVCDAAVCLRHTLRLLNRTKRLYDLLVVTDLVTLFQNYDDEAQSSPLHAVTLQ